MDYCRVHANCALLTVFIRPEAADDASRARRWLESVRPGLGADFQAELGDLFDRLQRQPALYPALHRDCRRAVLRRFDYSVVYRLLPDRIQVIGVLHCRLNPAVMQAPIALSH
ncbi:MAG: type II toxin-antitoxin system RelE/ParE family toxin [Phycisphaerales bacterium]|nr:type II toxin-antitoxin system RelE/ParE family toxin [Phycisphaerales bacterium]